MDFTRLNHQIILPSDSAAKQAKSHWDSIAKPIGSLGALEDTIIRIAALTGDPNVTLTRRAVLVFCADNGVVAEGVTQTGQEVTSIVAENMTRAESSVCRMAKVAHADVFPVDVGMVRDAPNVRNCKIARGTNNFTQGAAMTSEQAIQAIQTGMDLVGELKANGYCVIATGEMGIGNTTTASALASVLCNIAVEDATGRGAGLSDSGLQRKIDAIYRGIAVNQPDPKNAFDVLCKLGGFDIAAMAGAFLGGAVYRVPIIIDGVISAVAALIAYRLCPNSLQAMIPSHVSAEPVSKAIFAELGLHPMIHAGMRLGEGTGAVCMMPLLDMALAVYADMVSFSDIGVEQYKEPTA